MHLVTKNVRLVALVVAVVAVVLAASSLAPPPERASAAGIQSPQGVLCGTFEGMTLNDAPFYTGRFGMSLTRIDLDYDPDDGNPNDVAISAVAYLDTAVAGPPNLTWPDCKTYQTMPPSGAIEPNVKAEVRPGVFGVWNGTDNISGDTCQDDFTFGGNPFPPWTKVGIKFDLSTKQITGTFTFASPYTNSDCDVEDTGFSTFVVSFKADYYDGGDVAEAKSAYDSDWDKDGCRDWDELDPSPLVRHLDPFKSDLVCSPVGGIAQLPQVTGGTPVEAAGSSSTNSALIAGVVAVGTAVVLAAGGTAWYARRRWLG